MTLDPRAFSIWDSDAKQWVVAPGEYGVLVGDSSPDLPLKAQLQVTEPNLRPTAAEGTRLPARADHYFRKQLSFWVCTILVGIP